MAPLLVQLVAVPYGQPHRWYRPTAIRLTPCEWIRWQVNYRFSGGCSGEWSYRDAGQCSALHGGGEGPCWEGSQGLR